VYLIVLLRIYEHGEFLPDTVEALSRRTGYKTNVVSNALQTLTKSGRLILKDQGYFNPVADTILEERRLIRKKRKDASEKAAEARPKKAQQKQRTPRPFDDRIDNQSITKTPLPPLKRGRAKRKTIPGTALPEDWQRPIG
jgi:hypothetical protein